jgi:hypothetical protein
MTKIYFGGSGDGVEMPKEYKKREYSGICVCTHDSEDHHGSMVMNIDYSSVTGEYRMAEECEFYGFNEDTDSHCPMYWDKDNPGVDPYAAKRPDPPSKEIRDIWYRFKLFKWVLEDIKELAHNVNDHNHKEMLGRLIDIAQLANDSLEKDKTL